jgi:hypothetical protein
MGFEGGSNFYMYVDADPVNWVDLDGLDPVPVGTVIQIVSSANGRRFFDRNSNTHRAKAGLTIHRNGKTLLAYEGDPVYIGDSYATDCDTTAMLELITGGRVGINKGTRITVMSKSAVREGEKPLWRRIVLTNGRIWANMGKRKDTLEIETNGGVIGDKG